MATGQLVEEQVMAADPNAARVIFMTALDKTEPAERVAYLAQACGGDDKLRQRVEVLLKANDDPGSFLKSPANVDATDFRKLPGSSLALSSTSTRCRSLSSPPQAWAAS